MDHAEALEHIELAAAEPGGLDRLVAGDTPDAAAVAGHMAGCPGCAQELEAIRSVALVTRDVLRAQPDPALRERTLAFVRALGRPRGTSAVPGPSVAREPATPREPAAGDVGSVPAAAGTASRRTQPGVGWAVGLAAALVVALVAGFAAGVASRDDRIADQAAQISVLERTTATLLDVGAQPDARQVRLAAVDGGPAAGSLAFSPGTSELVVQAVGLTGPGEGREYGCWVEVDGVRTRIGRMYFGGEVAGWAGPVDGLADIPPGALFGVSLGPVGGGPEAVPVLTGRL